MGCTSCTGKVNPCNPCKKQDSCEQRATIDWVPNTACTIGITVDGITDTLELKEGIQNCETKTHMTFNTTTGCIEYQNELYVSTDGQQGYLEIICASEIAKYINLEDLANVEDEQPENCALLVYHADDTCGAGCTGIHDSWVHWYANEHLTNGLHFVAGFNEGGCLEALDVPPRTNEYWWGMWRPNETGTGTQFGYIQPQNVGELPKDESGKTTVLSQDANGKPIYGTISQAFNLCNRAVHFTARNADPQGRGFFQANSETTQEFLVTPDDNQGWRAPCCGVMIINYCVNLFNQTPNESGLAEVDTTCMLDTDTWSDAIEARDSTHSSWTLIHGRTSSVSETCGASFLVPAGHTVKLHARDTGDNPSTGMSTWGGSWRVHAVKATFIPLENI